MKLYYEKEGRKMKNIIKVEYMYTNAMRVIVTIIILAIYNAKIGIFGIYILFLVEIIMKLIMIKRYLL